MSTSIAAAPYMAGHTVGDRIGHIEETGIEFIPEAARDSRPANVAAVFFGGNLAFSVIVFGWLPITFGLGWWSAVTASAIGLAIGTLVTVPLALLGPRTGTNNTVSSGAHFGVTGRLVGSALTLAFALAYAAIAVWTSGDALVGGAHRLLGTPTGDGALAVGYALIAIEIAAVALYGHGTVVALQKIVVPVVGVLLLLGIVAFAGSFDAGYGGGDYILGGFWQTWVLADHRRRRRAAVLRAEPRRLHAPDLARATATARSWRPRPWACSAACWPRRCSARSPRSRSARSATPTWPISSTPRRSGTCRRS